MIKIKSDNSYKIMIFGGKLNSNNVIYEMEYNKEIDENKMKEELLTWNIYPHFTLPYGEETRFYAFSYNNIINDEIILIIGGRIGLKNKSDKIILMDFESEKLEELKQVNMN